MSKQSSEDFRACLAADAEIRRQIAEEDKQKEYRRQQIEDMKQRRGKK